MGPTDELSRLDEGLGERNVDAPCGGLLGMDGQFECFELGEVLSSEVQSTCAEARIPATVDHGRLFLPRALDAVLVPQNIIADVHH